MLSPSAAQAAKTQAGVKIDNTATATYDEGGNSVSVDSNKLTITVDEIIDVTVDWIDSADVKVAPASTDRPLAFTVTNTGNGSEAFGLTFNGAVGGDNFDPNNVRIYIDDGDGIFDSDTDTVYIPGAGDPTIAADATVRFFVVSDIPGGLADNDRGGVEITATAKTISGTPGATEPNEGQGGGSAVVGSTGGSANDTGFYQVTAATVALTKSATVLDPFGGATTVPGSIITYTLSAVTTGSGILPKMGIQDPIPTGTTYEPNSMTLAGAPLSDAADADAGTFASGEVAVVLGDVPGGQTRTVTFKVKVDSQ